MTHPARLNDNALLAECDVSFMRRSGPGGQHRNKVETAVLLRHRPTGVAAEAAERRTQAENRRAALRRLRVNLALAIRSDPAEPSALWRSRCRGGRIRVNPRHDDFPPLLAEALDHVIAAKGDSRAAAAQLGCTPTQLVSLVKLEPAALTDVNRVRREAGLSRLV